MTTKLTPGPWSHNGDPIFKYLTILVRRDTNTGHVVALKGLPIDEAKANANLLVSAPDLYEALKGVIEGIDNFCVSEAHFQKGRAALAKAESGA
jgi:hypothetical protein